MQKHQIQHFVFDSLQTSPFGGPSTSGRPQIKQLLGTKSYWNLIVGRIYFIQKCQIPKYLFKPPLEKHVWGALVPQHELRSKK
jgi:hypothetical protein